VRRKILPEDDEPTTLTAVSVISFTVNLVPDPVGAARSHLTLTIKDFPKASADVSLG